MLDGRDTDVLFGPETWLDSLRPVMAASVTDGQGPVDVTGRVAGGDGPSDRGDAERFRSCARRGRGDRRSLWGAEPPDSAYTSADSAVREALLVDREAFVADAIPALPDLYAAAGSGVP